MGRRIPLVDRFWSKADCSGECWEWRAAFFRCGYGQIREKGHNLYAHRVAWQLTNGEIPPDKWVLHTCDNRKCINPSHLFLGTPKDNSADMSRKGRACRGERHWKNKLTRDQVLEIRSSELPRKQLAAQYGVSPTMIKLIRLRKFWAWLEAA